MVNRVSELEIAQAEIEIVCSSLISGPREGTRHPQISDSPTQRSPSLPYFGFPGPALLHPGISASFSPQCLILPSLGLLPRSTTLLCCHPAHST
ncbi:hypothetical protein Y1Q_0004071 [Alligator mississippiensis]|uniref:Uncharacterized protein n=1 Tax=Alligator mississippiensis TaxID=8496 RepID=A0A151PII9_ALLMI|nr:hypothetical protein Y1Q_0004071 [Alligator mississippiensis]